MTMGFSSRGNDPVSVEQIENGYVVKFEGRDEKSNWVTKEYYFSDLKPVFEAVSEFFNKVEKG